MKRIICLLLSVLLLFFVTVIPAEAEGKDSSGILVQSGEKGAIGETLVVKGYRDKSLVLDEGETLTKETKEGYSTKKSRSLTCTHTTADVSGSIRCEKAANPLNPTDNELKANVKLTGTLSGKKVNKRIESVDAGGVNNTVSHRALYAGIDSLGIEEKTLAEPYVCTDNYAGYSYYERYYSYCPNTENFYYIGSSHVWLGCTRGDQGSNEYHYYDFSHTINLYKMIPNQYKIYYDASGGSGAAFDMEVAYDEKFVIDIGEKFSRIGYTFAGWNTKKNGSGTAYGAGKSAKNLTSVNGKTITLYAQWEPNVYSITLDRQLKDLDVSGTGRIYKKYETGWYTDKKCDTELENITIPEKKGYRFLGYYSSQVGGTKMIDKNGKLTKQGISCKQRMGNATWHAQYGCLISCEDFADIPFDMEKLDGDIREDISIKLTYDRNLQKVTVLTPGSGCTVYLDGLPAGTMIGTFRSVTDGDSAAGGSGMTRKAEFFVKVREGAAYRLRISLMGKEAGEYPVYYKDGRFRTLAKLESKEDIEAEWGGSVAGSDWGTQEKAYRAYQYRDCTSLTDIRKPGCVYRYFCYKNVNMAYSGNGASSGENILEVNVPLEDFYQFRDNSFTKVEKKIKRTKEGKAYDCEVMYGFDGWEMSPGIQYPEGQHETVAGIFLTADIEKKIMDHTTEDIRTYRKEEAIAGQEKEASVYQAEGAADKQSQAEEYINFHANWNAFPTITVTPGECMEFYEGEEVTKEELVSHLTAHDEEDNRDMNRNPDLNDRLRIIKISYPASQNGSQKAYENTYEEDVPDDFLLDTYYLKLEKDEVVDACVTFAVTDSSGNTIEEEIMVRIKYNNYPVINCEDVFYYFKEEANRGEITAQTLIGRAAAEDEEDGDITAKLQLKDFDEQIIKTQTEPKGEFDVIFQVTDAYGKTSYRTVLLLIWDEDAVIAEMPKHYVRFISEKYLDTLEKDSVWREPENLAYLHKILQNTTPVQTWEFKHEDVLEVQKWITENGSGNWKIGQAANREFIKKFAACRN